jgi:hypothetical protein
MPSGESHLFVGLIHDTFRMYRMPRRTHYDRYLIGGDVAEGMDQGDYCVAYVLDRNCLAGGDGVPRTCG